LYHLVFYEKIMDSKLRRQIHAALELWCFAVEKAKEKGKEHPSHLPNIAPIFESGTPMSLREIREYLTPKPPPKKVVKYVGIDPGFYGAVAVWDSMGGLIIHDMPLYQIKITGGKTRNRIDIDTLVDMFASIGPALVGLEYPSTRPGEGAQACFNFGEQLGMLQVISKEIDNETALIPPQTWKRKLGVKGKEKKDAIPEMVALYKELFPNKLGLLKGPRGGIKDGRLEAALIAAYHKMTRSKT
jgi:hypothetical protein